MFYGLVTLASALEIVRAVCGCLGYGAKGVADLLLLETAAQESHLGQYQDRTRYGAGTGLCQCDLIAFNDVKRRTRVKDKALILQTFGIYIDAVEYRELELSPLLSFIFCRLHYKLVPDEVPVELIDRAHYWKRFYNTAAGKGTAEEYIGSVGSYLHGVNYD